MLAHVDPHSLPPSTSTDTWWHSGRVMDLKFRCNECCSFSIFGRPLTYISIFLRELSLCSSFGVWCLVWSVYSHQMKMTNGSGFVSLFLCCHVSCLIESFLRVSSLLSVLFPALCPLLPSTLLVETGCGFYCCGHVGPASVCPEQSLLLWCRLDQNQGIQSIGFQCCVF